MIPWTSCKTPGTHDMSYNTSHCSWTPRPTSCDTSLQGQTPLDAPCRGKAGPPTMEDPKSGRDPPPQAPRSSAQGTPLAPLNEVPWAAPQPCAALGTHCNPSPSPGAAVGAKNSK